MAEQHIRRLEEAYLARIRLLRDYLQAEKEAITSLHSYLAQSEIIEFEHELEAHLQDEKKNHAAATKPWREIRRTGRSIQ